MKSIFDKLKRSGWYLLIAPLVALFGLTIYVNLKYEVYFDDHHITKNPHFGHWFMGLFRNWHEGPLTIGVREGPGDFRYGENFSRKQYIWHLKQVDKDFEILFERADEKYEHVFLTYLPQTKRVIFYIRDPEKHGLRLRARGDLSKNFDAACEVKNHFWNQHYYDFLGETHSIPITRRLGETYQIENKANLLDCEFEIEKFSLMRTVRHIIHYDKNAAKWRIEETIETVPKLENQNPFAPTEDPFAPDSTHPNDNSSSTVLDPFADPSPK